MLESHNEGLMRLSFPTILILMFFSPEGKILNTFLEIYLDSLVMLESGDDSETLAFMLVCR